MYLLEVHKLDDKRLHCHCFSSSSRQLYHGFACPSKQSHYDSVLQLFCQKRQSFHVDLLFQYLSHFDLSNYFSNKLLANILKPFKKFLLGHVQPILVLMKFERVLCRQNQLLSNLWKRLGLL
jgi:hypothetical protein